MVGHWRAALRWATSVGSLWEKQAWFGLDKQNWPHDDNVLFINCSLVMMYWNWHPLIKVPGWNLTLPSQKIIVLCCVLTSWHWFKTGLSCQNTKQSRDASTYQSGYLSYPAFFLQPTSSPHMPHHTSWTHCVENPGQWRDGLCHEWLMLCNLLLSWLISTGISLQ